MANDLAKRHAGEKAVEFINEGMTIGLGSGSTIYWFLNKLAESVKAGMEIQGIPTSTRTESWAKQFGIPLTDFATVDQIDVAIDGADEINEQFNLIKGGGGSLVREKIVDAYADQLIIIADQSKQVQQLGAFPLPIEVVPFGWEITANYVTELGGQPKLRMKDGKPFISDNGNYILDSQFEEILHAKKLHENLKSLVGVVETGLFIQMTDVAIIGDETGATILRRDVSER